jgi:hypothetical protein
MEPVVEADPLPPSGTQEVESNNRYLIIYNISKRKNIKKLLSVAVAYRFNVALVCGSQAFAAAYSRCFDEIAGCQYSESRAGAGTSRSACAEESIALVNTQTTITFNTFSVMIAIGMTNEHKA